MLKKPILFLGMLGLAVLLSAGATQAQYNPSGWIQTDGWNLLFPLGNPDGCAGGGVVKMAGNWVAPHQIGLEDPAAGDEWDDIDFGGAALATGWLAGAINPNPIWVTNDFLEGAFAGLSMPNGDVVDFQAMAETISAYATISLQNDNVVGLATTYVENLTGAPLAVQICTASDDSVQAWVNNLMVTNVSSCRGTAGDCAERNPAILPVGVSKISTLTFEGGGGWGFRLAIEVGGVKQTDTSTLVKFLGPVGQGQVQYGATRTRVDADPFVCDNDTASMKIVGNAAAGADADALTVVETLAHSTEAEIEVTDVSNGGVVADIIPALNPVGALQDHRVVGVAPCGGASTTTYSDGGTPADPSDDVYTSVSNTGHDIWDAGDANNDSFEFAYSRLKGDFDVAIAIVAKSNTTATRWGKWGLMARWDYDRASRYTIMQDHSNDPQDPCRLAGRTSHRVGGYMYEDLQASGDPALDHPTFMRLKRAGNVVTGYISNDPGVIATPGDGGPWVQVGRNDDWGAGAPEEILVGFANSQHNSGGCGEQTVSFTPINLVATPVPITSGKTITWNVTRGDVNAGLSYKVSQDMNYSPTGALSFGVSFAGEIVGESSVIGTPGLGTAGETLQAIPRTGPIGIFEDSHDIGTPPTIGYTSYDAATGAYTVFGSGGDIWDGGDDFQFAYKRVTGDFVATARVASRGTNNAGYRWGRHGLMARWSCRDNAKFTMLEEMFPTTAGEVDWIRHHFRMYDQNAGNNRDYLQVNDGIFPNQGQFPSFLRIQRKGNAIYSFLSEDANGDMAPDKWVPIFADTGPASAYPATMLVGLAVQGRQEWGQTAVFDKVTIEPLDECYTFDALLYETSATNTAGIGSRPYAPVLVTAQVPADLASAVAAGGSGLGVKNRNWIWTDLSAGAVDLSGTTQLLWNNENRNFAGAHIAYTFHSDARVYIAWDNRLVKGGSDNPDGTVDNGWFDFNNDVGTVNAQGWLRLTGRSTDDAPLPEEIRTDGDSAFARGGVWAKDVAGGDVLDFLATGYSAGRSPYVVFVSCASDCEKGGELASLDFEDANDMGIVVVRGGTFTPVIAGGRLRVTDETVGGSGTMVWYGVPADPDAGGVPLLADGFVAEFDAFLTRTGLPGDVNPADALGFVVVATGANDGLASAVGPWVPYLDVASLGGDGGGSLGYHGGTMMERTESHPNFMIEMDTWYGSSDATNEPYGYGSTDFDGYYHFGLNLAGQANSIQTNADLGVSRDAMPDAFNPAGMHVEVEYKPSGEVKVWASGVDKAGNPVPRTLMISKGITPLTTGDVVLGFVGGTGGAVQTGEIDNFVVSGMCCESPDAVTIAGPAAANQSETASYSADFSGAGLGASVTYAWTVVSGSATVASPDAATTDVTFNSAGEVVLAVAADDGACAGISASAQYVVTVTPQTCGLTVTASEPDAEARTVALTVTVGTDPAGCNCDNIVVRQGGADLYTGPVAGMPATFDLPEDCCDADITYDVVCVGPLGEGSVATVTVHCPPCGTPFIRGDCNQDGEVCGSVSDLVRMCEILFLGAATTTCPAACDANGDGVFAGEVTDITYLADYCFVNGLNPPPAPYPECGIVADLPENTPCEEPTFCSTAP